MQTSSNIVPYNKSVNNFFPYNPPLIIFDFDDTLIKRNSSFLEIIDGNIYDIDEELVKTVDIVDSQLITTLLTYKSKRNALYIIMTANTVKHVKLFADLLFPPGLFDHIIDTGMCYNIVQKDKFAKQEYSAYMFMESTMITSNKTRKASKTPCLRYILKYYNLDGRYAMFFDDNMDIINDAKTEIFWSIPCPTGLTSKIFNDALIAYNNTMERIANILNVSSTGYLPPDYINFFIKSTSNNRLCCDPLYIRYIIELINHAGESSGIIVPMTFINDPETNNLIDRYFTFLIEYTGYDHKLYSLGDSLDKLNFIWNSLVAESKITVIPFSGSMYQDDVNSSIVLDPVESEKILSSISDLYNNNETFREMIIDLSFGRKIFISDYGHTGKALITLITIIRMILSGNDMDPTLIGNITILQVCGSGQTIYDNIVINLQDGPLPNIIYYEISVDPYFTNSDRLDSGFNSRCVPRYTVDSWNNPPSDVWKNGSLPNYRLCNIHRLLFVLQICCHLKTIFTM